MREGEETSSLSSRVARRLLATKLTHSSHASQTQFHLASTKQDVIRYRQYVHVQNKVKGRRLFDAFKAWSAQVRVEKNRSTFRKLL